MKISKNKSIAIARLKNGEAIDDIAKILDLSPSIVQEWSDDLSPSELISKETHVLALDKAVTIISNNNENTDKDMLKDMLLKISVNVANEITSGTKNYEIAKAINTTANTIATLQKAFFAPANIAILGNNNIPTIASEELKRFGETLKD